MTGYLRSRTFAQDRDFLSAASLFRRAKKLELHYARRLRGVARYIGEIVAGFDAGTARGTAQIQQQLHRYADALQPWAESVGTRMVAEVAASNRESWRRASATVGRLLHKEIETAPTGLVMRESLARQVDLITSLPREAGERVHRLTTVGMARGRRTSAIVDDIMRSGEVSSSRAELIATTEVSRTATELTQARATHVGSTQYQWCTVGDGDVRHDHRILNGQAFAWSAPPVADRRTGARAHPGCIYRCRCYARPLFADAA